jgi:hypothetical protein
MAYVVIIPDSREIRDEKLKVLFEDKVGYLKNSLERYQDMGVSATVYIRGRQNSRSIFTFTAVECDDKEFKILLEDVVRTFNTLPSVLS